MMGLDYFLLFILIIVFMYEGFIGSCLMWSGCGHVIMLARIVKSMISHGLRLLWNFWSLIIVMIRLSCLNGYGKFIMEALL